MPNSEKKIIFEAKGLVKEFGHGKTFIQALKGLDFTMEEGEIITLVGGSACGKSVLAKHMLGFLQPTKGTFTYLGKPVTNQRDHWQDVQPIFQDPFSAFNQFYTIRSQLEDSLKVLYKKPSKEEIKKRVDEALLKVNVLPEELEGKFPFELSGGQMQRMLLARIFALKPKVLIADEATSMVDACVRANILDYMMKLRDEGMSIVFISHDIGLAYYVSDRIFIMHDGEIVEQGTPDEVALHPKTEQTKRLLDDIPDIHKEWIKRPGRDKKQ
jgi:peptide/nickel transport system ATP-binding protein